MTSRRVAAIDVGTNTALLLIADPAPGGMVIRRLEDRFVRLGAGVDRHRTIQHEAMERLRHALLDFRAIAEADQVDAIVVGATSASRDARNIDALIDFVWEETGLRYEVLTGEEEARWSFNGALSDLPPESRSGQVATVDIGGGSTEIVVGAWDDRAGAWEVRDAHSFDMGSVRVTERFFAGQPPDRPSVEQARSWVRAQLEARPVVLPAGIRMIGASGTTTSLALLEGGVSRWDALAEALPSLSAARIAEWEERLLRLSYDDVLALGPVVMQGRADVFPAGVLILSCLCDRFGLQACTVTSRGLRHGLALRYWQETSPV